MDRVARDSLSAACLKNLCIYLFSLSLEEKAFGFFRKLERKENVSLWVGKCRPLDGGQQALLWDSDDTDLALRYWSVLNLVTAS